MSKSASNMAFLGGSSPISGVEAKPQLLPLPYSQRLQEHTSAPSFPQSSPSDGMEGLSERAVLLRFGRDLRLLEVRRLLRSSLPVKLTLGATPEVSDAEGAQHQQIRLMVLAMRTMALPMGECGVSSPSSNRINFMIKNYR